MNCINERRRMFWQSEKSDLLEQLNDAVLEAVAKMRRQKQWCYCDSPIIREFKRDHKELLAELRSLQQEELLEYAFVEALSLQK